MNTNTTSNTNENLSDTEAEDLSETLDRLNNLDGLSRENLARRLRRAARELAALAAELDG